MKKYKDIVTHIETYEHSRNMIFICFMNTPSKLFLHEKLPSIKSTLRKNGYKVPYSVKLEILPD